MDLEAARTKLIEHLSSEIGDERVLAAMAHIPRERFVLPEEQDLQAPGAVPSAVVPGQENAGAAQEVVPVEEQVI